MYFINYIAIDYHRTLSLILSNSCIYSNLCNSQMSVGPTNWLIVSFMLTGKVKVKRHISELHLFISKMSSFCFESDNGYWTWKNISSDLCATHSALAMDMIHFSSCYWNFCVTLVKYHFLKILTKQKIKPDLWWLQF